MTSHDLIQAIVNDYLNRGGEAARQGDAERAMRNLSCAVRIARLAYDLTAGAVDVLPMGAMRTGTLDMKGRV